MTKPTSAEQRADRLTRLSEALRAMTDRMDAFREEYGAQIEGAHDDQRRGARNLVDYLAFRGTDGTSLEPELAALGLASLSQVGPNVRASIDALVAAVHALAGAETADPPDSLLESGPALVRARTDTLFGPKEGGSPVRIMVTMPTVAADDPDVVREMVRSGMNVARINCAHDGADVWLRMIENIRAAAAAEEVSVRVFMDLAGPKIRIGSMPEGPRVRKLGPKLDARGRPKHGGRVFVVPEGATDVGPAPDGARVLPVSAEVTSALRPGTRVEFVDARGTPAVVEIDDVLNGGGVGTCAAAVYAETGLPVVLRDVDGNETASGRIGRLPAQEVRLNLADGDILTLHKEDVPGQDPIPATASGGARPGRIAVGLSTVVDALQIGERVYISDGKVTGEVVAKRADEVDVLITRAGIDGARVKQHKGLNLPDTRLGLFGLTEKDREDLRFVIRHADGVNVSFIQHPDDVEDLLDELEALGAEDLGVVLKIETRGAVTHLPGILLAAMEWPSVGVMIARGDLAIEVGWLELAEVIEEILMLCEAAHLPSIWATEVLDRLAKKGVPARGEVSDVVMAGRAECIMLNKGPYITLAIRGLDRVLTSLQAYRAKRAVRLPALRLALPDATEVGREIGDRLGRWEDPASD